MFHQRPRSTLDSFSLVAVQFVTPIKVSWAYQCVKLMLDINCREVLSKEEFALAFDSVLFSFQSENKSM